MVQGGLVKGMQSIKCGRGSRTACKYSAPARGRVKLVV